jgi:hypothetical protein
LVPQTSHHPLSPAQILLKKGKNNYKKGKGKPKPSKYGLQMVYMEMEIQHWCMFIGNKICVQILWLRKDHMQGALLIGTALRLAWNLSS